MSYLSNHDDFQEGTLPRLVRRAPAGTNPLQITPAERDNIQRITDILVGRPADPDKKLPAKIGLITINSSAIIHQVRGFHATLRAIDALMSRNVATLVSVVVEGLTEIDRVQATSPFIIPKHDGAQRNLASDERGGLKDMAMRLAKASRGQTPAEVDLALCLRALVCAAISLERGLLHLAKENLGVIIRTIHDKDCTLRGRVDWTPELTNLAQRHRFATVKMP